MTDEKLKKNAQEYENKIYTMSVREQTKRSLVKLKTRPPVSNDETKIIIIHSNKKRWVRNYDGRRNLESNIMIQKIMTKIKREKIIIKNNNKREIN